MSLAGQPRVQLKRVQRRSRRGYASRGPAVSVVACPFSPPRGCDPYSDIKSTHLRRQGRRPKSRLVTASRRSRVSVTCASPHQGAPSGGSVTRCAEEKQRKAAPAPVWKREEWDVHSLVTAALLSEALPKGAGSGGPARLPPCLHAEGSVSAGLLRGAPEKTLPCFLAVPQAGQVGEGRSRLLAGQVGAALAPESPSVLSLSHPQVRCTARVSRGGFHS